MSSDGFAALNLNVADGSSPARTRRATSGGFLPTSRRTMHPGDRGLSAICCRSRTTALRLSSSQLSNDLYNWLMTSTSTDSFVLRDLDPASDADLEWVANGMHLTLVEVEGERGRQAYPLTWARKRLRELIDPARHHTAHVFLAVSPNDPRRIAGHTILRINEMPDGRPYGLVSTTYVDPAHRRTGVADRLLDRGEVWIRAQGMVEAATWTSATNMHLIHLYEKHGYAATERAAHNDGTMMVRLTKALATT
jgi:GNAT superfamily N-acetyltransferase